ncbi:MAG TPA: 23S rRNA (adenine(2030)-N(6))-methyltransferase RlmJ, partial [Burkholderiales bacterium]|nr:23S rRNA (adenine(2030)-N(6))-methyltransferase RlmJ [Burkholderiales bacterium]
YHAGNFADVFKHALLARLLIALNSKDKAYCYLDTHAGIGLYDLAHPWAHKAREYENGIGKLWERQDIPELLRPYMDTVREENKSHRLRFYPGSPLIARRFLRPVDRMVLTELNKTDVEVLKAVFEKQRRVAVHCMDAYQGLKAFLPPQERRGLMLVDSSFDRSREFDRIVRAMKEAHERWATGMYAVWYPMMEVAPMRDFAASVTRSGIRKILRLELTVRERDESGFMPGCGMLVVNPPWHFEEEARAILDYLRRVLGVEGAGRADVKWLVPE